MSKKNKRQVQRATPTPPPTPSPSVEAATPGPKVSTSRGSDRDFNPDYSYVIKDLKRIGLLAGVFFAILIVLSFIL